MRDGGRIAAALAVLDDFRTRRVPLKVSLADWARGARYAGAKDRAFISGLALDILRRDGTLLAAVEGNRRAATALALRAMWGWPAERIAAAFAEEPHGPGRLSDAQLATVEAAAREREAFGQDPMGDIPEFTRPMLARIADDPAAEVLASSKRAPIDLRINPLKGPVDRAMRAMEPLGAAPSPLAELGLRIPAPAPEDRGPAIESAPAYLKGWVEVQDEASQLAALAAGAITKGEVLDYCAGGGGKTLALAALLANRGQVFAYDADPRRLAPVFERARRAGARNVQIVSPADGGEGLLALGGRMDVVFVDAPCTGSGTWRRRPDTKWRLTERQLAARIAEQDQVLREAAVYVRPGGALVYATCSFFAEENEDRIAAFLTEHPVFTHDDTVAALVASGGLREKATSAFHGGKETGSLRLTPARSGTDGFTITRLLRMAS